jgi:hypothetical protein
MQASRLRYAPQEVPLWDNCVATKSRISHFGLRSREIINHRHARHNRCGANRGLGAGRARIVKLSGAKPDA